MVLQKLILDESEMTAARVPFPSTLLDDRGSIHGHADLATYEGTAAIGSAPMYTACLTARLESGYHQS
jgi:hypothetical protein